MIEKVFLSMVLILLVITVEIVKCKLLITSCISPYSVDIAYIGKSPPDKHLRQVYSGGATGFYQKIETCKWLTYRFQIL